MQVEMPFFECAEDALKSAVQALGGAGFLNDSTVSRLFRDAVLDLARDHEFARRIVNSGRLSVPATLHGSALNTPDTDTFDGTQLPGAVLADAPMRRPGVDGTAWLLRALGPDFTLLHFGPTPAWAQALPGVLNGRKTLQLEFPYVDCLKVQEHFGHGVVYLNEATGESFDEALKRIRDPADWPALALALQLECAIWTEDQDFFGTGIPTWTTVTVEIYLAAT